MEQKTERVNGDQEALNQSMLITKDEFEEFENERDGFIEDIATSKQEVQGKDMEFLGLIERLEMREAQLREMKRFCELSHVSK